MIVVCAATSLGMLQHNERNLGIRMVYARYGDWFSGDRISVGADYIIDAMGRSRTVCW